MREEVAVPVQHVFGIASAEERIQEPTIQIAVSSLRRCAIRLAGAGRMRWPHVQCDADVRGVRRAQCAGRFAMRQQQMMRDAQGRRPVLYPRRMHAAGMSGERHDLGLVQRHPVLDPIAEPRRDDARILAKPLWGVGIGPAVAALQGLGQIPVVERDERANTSLQQRIHESLVEVQATLVDRARPIGDHPRPADGAAVGVEAKRADQRDVLAPAVIVIAGDVAGLAGRDRPGHPRERVPDRRSFAIRVMTALDLIRGGRGAKEEVRWEPAPERLDLTHRGSTSSQRRPIRAVIPPSTYST